MTTTTMAAGPAPPAPPAVTRVRDDDPATVRASGVALGRMERVGTGAVVALAAVLGLIGAVNSFARVEAAVAPSFGRLAWTVPLGIDIGIAVFTGLDLVMARMGMRLAWLRLVPWALVATTIYLNVAGEDTAIGVVAHAVLPGLWVIAVEVGGHVMRSWAGLTGTGPERRRRLDRVRLSRWVLAPVSTARLRRRMILQEIVSYHDALAWDARRRRAKSDMQDTYGRWSWRWQAPRRRRIDYRLGDLDDVASATEGPLADTPALPERTSTNGEGADEDVTAVTANGAGGRVDAGTARASSRAGSERTARSAPPRRSSRPSAGGVAELVPVGAEIAAGADGRLSRTQLVNGLRARGLGVGGTKAAELMAVLKQEGHVR